jgi:C_GCAxxG_C_C family probable redox protein
MAGYTASLGPAQRFCQRFEAELGSTMCGDIVAAQCGRRFNLADPVEFAEFQVSGAEKCPAVVQTGVRIGAEILSDKVSPNPVELDELDKKVKEYLAFSGHCAQTSFLTLTEYFALDGPILKALTPFPGIALRGETCGAVVGSLMAMGLVYGRDRLDDWPGYTASLAPSQRFCSAFEEQLGGTMCGDIIEAQFGRRADLRNPTDMAELQAAGFLEKCTEVVRTGVRIAAEIIVGKGGPTAVEMKNNLPTTLKELKAID